MSAASIFKLLDCQRSKGTVNPTKERIKRLEKHLKQENPILSGCVDSFTKLDRIACGLGLANAGESFATQVSWWPVIAVLGTFSAGKSTFLNQYVGQDLQRTGNQAVDDKFTVICYGTGDSAAALPGLALDSDPRFPFYQISRNIEQLGEGEGRRIDSYLQLKTAKAESLRGKIVIDSPGFDADSQRTSTLRLTSHIIDLSDFVSQSVRFAFHIQDDGDGASYAGWYIDEVSIDEGICAPWSPEDFEEDVDCWYADNGVWQIDAPSYGPANGAYQGAHVDTKNTLISKLIPDMDA